MVYISTRAMYNEDNEFQLKEIYVSDGDITYVLQRDEGYVPYPYHISLQALIESTRGMAYPLGGFSELRSHPDDDAKSLAAFFRDKIAKINLQLPNAEKTLFEVMSNFGESANG